MAVPNRPADETQSNVGKRYGPPQDTSTAPDNNFAGTSYVTGCSGDTATNPGQPSFRYVLNDGTTLNSNNLTVTESDGTVKQYFLGSSTETTTDTYNTNPGLTDSQWNALSASQKALYCDGAPATGGVITGVSITDSGEYIATASAGAGSSAGNGDASFDLTYGTRTANFGQSKYLKSVSIKNGGTGYKVGDTFTVAGVDFSPSIQQPAKFKVTSATPITGGGGTRYLKVPSKRVREVSRPLNVRIWNPTAEPPPEADCKPAGQVVNTITVTGYIKGGTLAEQMTPPNVIGNGPYADASDFSQAVVHAGIAQEGETVTVDLVSYSQDKFAGWFGETRNGVIAIATNDAYCAYNIIPKTSPPNTGNDCTPSDNYIDKELIIGGANQTALGIPTRVSVVNPEVKPGQGITSGANSPASNENGDWNWYESCPVQAAGLPSGWDLDYRCGYGVFFVDGPSAGSGVDKGTITWGTTIQVYREPSPSSNWPETGCKYPFTNINGGPAYKDIRWRVKDVGLRPTYVAWNPQPGHAIGDIWEFRSLGCITDNDVISGTRSVCSKAPNESSCSNQANDVVARFRIDAIDVESTDTDAKLDYTVETDVKFLYDTGSGLTTTNNTVLQGYQSTSDGLLLQSAQLVVSKFSNDLKRLPRDTEFVMWVRNLYANNGSFSPSLTSQFSTEFQAELSYLASGGSIPIQQSCNGGTVTDPDPDPDPPPIGEDTNCRYLRDEFYRGTNGTTNGQVDLNEIWNWLGSPKNNPNPICPRPENDQGLSQDNEPDMTDFAGLEIQRWQACTDGSNNGNPLLGGIQTETVPCTGDLDLSYFIDTRIAPWWGTQELAPPSLTMNKRNDNIYMVNVPPTQTETYFFKVQPTLTASNKKFFEVTGSVNYPSITGSSSPGEPAIVEKNSIFIAWYKRTSNNPGLEILGGIDTFASQTIFENGGSEITATGNPINGQSGTFRTTLTDFQAIDGQCSESESNQLDFTQSGLEYFCKVEIDNRPFNPKGSGNTFMPGFGGLDNNISSYLSYPSKFFLNNIECNDASVSCNSGGQVEVPTGTFTTITFSMTISTNCLQYRSGTARISVKREWPCPVFSPTSPTTNAWVVQKQSVSIPQTNQSSAVIQYTLQVPTDKSDYQPGEDGIDVAPGDCHWHYTAYWEIDYPGVACNSQAWSNPGCNYGEGRNQIDQIYCLQDNACTGGSSPSPSTPSPGGGCTNNVANCCDNVNNDPNCYMSFGCIDFRNYTGCPENGGGQGPASPGTGYDPNCECPICEQTIIVRVLEESECGILGTPNQVEGGGDGPNNARIQLYSPSEGSKIISDTTFNPIVLNKDVLIDCDPEYVPGTTPDQKCIEMGTDTWVYLTRKTFDTFTTLGDDAAVKFNEEGEADCEEKVFTQSTWYRQYFYKNGTKSAISFQPVYLGGAQYDSYLRRYNPTASTATEALRYKGEVGISSKKGTIGFIDMEYDIETVEAVKLFVNIASTNDYFGNAIYHPPPPGFNERDFGTTTYVSSQRGSVGATSNNPARKEIFEVAHFSIADKQDVPVFTGTAGIACPSGDVPFEGKRLPPDLFEFCCGGEIGGCQNYGVSFACQVACDGGGCDVAPLAGPKQEVVICATNSDNNQFGIDWKDIPGNERKQLLILWYMKEPGQGPRLFNIGNLSQGERCSPDVRRFLNKAESEYTLSYYIVASSDGSAAWRAIEYDAEGADGYFDVISWKLDPRYGTSGRAPVEQSEDRKEGERWQTIMGYAACTFRTGPDADGLNIENPAGSISITNITNPNGTFPSPGSPAIGNCNGGECCNPANTEYYTKRCIEIRSALQASGIQCCATSSPSPNVSPTPGPSPAPFSPVGPGPFNPSINPF